jgi:hypothetical protein
MTSPVVDRVVELKAQLESLDVQRAAIRAELDAITEALGFPARPKPRARIGSGRRTLRNGSAVFWAEKVLRHRGRPCHVDDLVKDIHELSGIRIQKTSLVGSLSKYVNARDTFTRPREGFYGLIVFLDAAQRRHVGWLKVELVNGDYVGMRTEQGAFAALLAHAARKLPFVVGGIQIATRDNGGKVFYFPPEAAGLLDDAEVAGAGFVGISCQPPEEATKLLNL